MLRKWHSWGRVECQYLIIHGLQTSKPDYTVYLNKTCPIVIGNHCIYRARD